MADQLATPQDLASLLQLTYASLTAAQQATLLMLVELGTAKVQRAAGGQRIVDLTTTAGQFDIDTDCWDPYLQLAQYPIRSVATVVLDGVTITDWRLRNQMLWRSAGWRTTSEPSQAVVTYTHGHIAGSQSLQLARGATLALGQLGWGNPDNVQSEAIDDYKVTYGEADQRMQLTEHMAEALRAAYGISAYTTGSR